MKKILTILFFVSIFSFTACEDPNQDVFEKQEQLVTVDDEKSSDFLQPTD